ncbi:MAG: hypothetical protein JNM18_23525 [Planctomycetaceae bacterium]|nr:hypothetical protein [Planctomycetaceae bacterium]
MTKGIETVEQQVEHELTHLIAINAGQVCRARGDELDIDADLLRFALHYRLLRGQCADS